MNIRDAIDQFCQALTDVTNAEFARQGDDVNTVRFEADKGGRAYKRIIRKSYVSGNHCQDSAHCFVKIDDGSLWKPAGWKGPAKNFPRGSVYDAPATSCIGNV